MIEPSKGGENRSSERKRTRELSVREIFAVFPSKENGGK